MNDAGTDALASVLAALARGEVIAYPTETFYGLGVDALNEAALERLQMMKGRGAEKAVSVLVTGMTMLERLCADVPPVALQLMTAYWPGALTIALPARPGLPAALVSDGCVAVRHSSHLLANSLVEAFARPITATSANPAGAPPPTTAARVRAYFAGCPMLDGGETSGGLPSTLVRVRQGQVEVLRQGAVTLKRNAL